jgi:hypothetical protein
MLRLQVDGPRASVNVVLAIHDETTAPLIHTPIYGTDSKWLFLPPGEHLLEIPLGIIELNSGKYNFVVGVTDPKTGLALTRVQGLRPFRVFSRGVAWGKIVRPAVAQLKPLPIESSIPPG